MFLGVLFVCIDKSMEVRKNMAGLHIELTMPRAEFLNAAALKVVLVPVVIFLSNGKSAGWNMVP